MAALADAVDSLAESGALSGLVSLSRGNVVEFERAYGLADPRPAVACTEDTMFAIASGTKGFTALVVSSLIEDGRLELSTTARSLLGSDLPLIRDEVTVEQLLADRSGVGDYVDEDADRELPPRASVGYLTGVDRTNIFPAAGARDGRRRRLLDGG
jgi:CubicO group peptidase (beta-lactamase class C family)